MVTTHTPSPPAQDAAPANEPLGDKGFVGQIVQSIFEVSTIVTRPSFDLTLMKFYSQEPTAQSSSP